MTENIELFDRALCFTPIWALVDIFLIFHFFFSWYRSVKRTKWKIDFWYLTLSIALFPSLLLLYPFNGSIYNNIFTMGFQYRILPYVDLAFAISVLGYLSIWGGRYLFDYTRGNFPLIIAFQLTRPICQIVENNIKSRRAYLFVILTAFFFGVAILGIQFKEGCFFNARGLFLKEPLLRPLFNITVSILPIATSFLALRYIQFKEKKCLIFAFVLLLFTLFFGVRSLFLNGILFLLTQGLFYRKGQCSFVKLVGIGFCLFFIAVLLGNLREGEDFSLQNALTALLFKFFYGNNFSDTRDFAWVLAFWDEEYVYGKTYLAALISFIPRVYSSMREEWSISMYTNSLTGFDSDVMPGLRPGMFGEAFLNFSYPGVIVFGLLFGFALRYADLKIKEHVMKSNDIIKGYSCLFIFILLSHLSVSASMWSFYIFLFINLAAFLFRNVLTTRPKFNSYAG
jgi:oligosaccharide repeat unit polymerase